MIPRVRRAAWLVVEVKEPLWEFWKPYKISEKLHPNGCSESM
jgi:hypothetical protein